MSRTAVLALLFPPLAVGSTALPGGLAFFVLAALVLTVRWMRNHCSSALVRRVVVPVLVMGLGAFGFAVNAATVDGDAADAGVQTPGWTMLGWPALALALCAYVVVAATVARASDPR